MRIPESLASLADYGIIDEALRPLMSGKEAQVYLVMAGGQECVAKVYKDAHSRTFKHRSTYTEGRKVRNSRDQRAMGKGSRHGRAQEEAAWRSAEVEMIYRLSDANVRVPKPYNFVDGVLVMELIKDADNLPAPRLGDLTMLSAGEAQAIFERLLAEVVRMLCAGVVHGDLSDFNVLMGADGPVIIDFPQAVDASSNQNAKKLLVRDVDNLHRFVARFVPEHEALPYAQEMWDLYQRSELTPDTRLTGRHRPSERRVDTRQVLSLIGDADHDERRRRASLGQNMPRSAKPEPRPAAVSQPSAASRPAAVRRPDPQVKNRQAEPRPEKRLEKPAAHRLTNPARGNDTRVEQRLAPRAAKAPASNGPVGQAAASAASRSAASTSASSRSGASRSGASTSSASTSAASTSAASTSQGSDPERARIQAARRRRRKARRAAAKATPQ
jgi:RIO kinase 1